MWNCNTWFVLLIRKWLISFIWDLFDLLLRTLACRHRNREAEQVMALVSAAASSLLLPRSTHLLRQPADDQTGTILTLQVIFWSVQHEFPQVNCTLVSDDCTCIGLWFLKYSNNWPTLEYQYDICLAKLGNFSKNYTWTLWLKHLCNWKAIRIDWSST